MKISFYFDPSCPFCWITSRWLLMISPHRDINIDWKPFSLAIKNGELDKKPSEAKHAHIHRQSHRLLRVFMSATHDHDVNIIDLYTSSGIKHHVAGFDMDDDHIKEILAEHKLPESLLKSADSDEFDRELADSITSATDVAGKDIGVPTIIFNNKDGDQQGFFGPVLQSLPELDEALELWDGLSKLASNSSFYELKRTRPNGGPDVFSTAKC